MRARQLIPLFAGVAACGITAIPLPGEEWRHRGADGAETGRETSTSSSTSTGSSQSTATTTSTDGATSTATQGTETSGATDPGVTGSSTATSTASDAASSTATATATIVDTDTSTAFKTETAWARWKMPHPAGAKDPVTNELLPNQASYTYNADSVTVVDNVTGLEWQRTPVSGTHPWAEAQLICARLVLDGKTDWRLPSRIELISLLDDTTATPPMIDKAAFPSTPYSTYYWSSSLVLVSGNEKSAWGLYGSTVTPLALTQSNYVRCVRGGGS